MSELTAIQVDLLAVMTRASIAVVVSGPHAVISLPEPYNTHWRDAHGGKPPQSHVVQALADKGLINRFRVSDRWVFVLSYSGWATIAKLAERLKEGT